MNTAKYYLFALALAASLSSACPPQFVPLEQHPEVPALVQEYQSLERQIRLRQYATWGTAAAAVVFVAYKVLSGPAVPAVPADETALRLARLEQAGFAKHLDQQYGIYEAAQKTWWNKVVYWSKTTIPGMIAGAGAHMAYQMVVNPWISLVTGPVARKLYSFALTEVSVLNTSHWWIAEQVGVDQPEASKNTPVPSTPVHVRIPYISWWLVQQMRIFDEAYRLQDRLALERAAIKLYAQLVCVEEHIITDEFEGFMLRTIAHQLAQHLDTLRVSPTDQTAYESCKNQLRRIRLLESYQILG